MNVSFAALGQTEKIVHDVYFLFGTGLVTLFIQRHFLGGECEE